MRWLPPPFGVVNANLLEAAKALPLLERIDLAEALWESITDEGHEPSLTPAQAEELDRRLEEHRHNPPNRYSLGAGQSGTERSSHAQARFGSYESALS